MVTLHAKPQIRAGVLPGAAGGRESLRQLGAARPVLCFLLAPLLEDDLISLLVLVEAAAGRHLLPLLLAEHVLGMQPGLEEVVILHEDLEVLVRDDLERGLAECSRSVPPG